MKKMILAAAAALSFAGTVQAAQLSSCLSHIEARCYGLTSTAAGRRNLRNLGSDTECKMIQASGVDNVLVFDHNTLVAVNASVCSIESAQLATRVTDTVVIGGRAFLATDAKRVVAVGRNGAIYEMLTSAGQPYRAVTGVRQTPDGRLQLQGTSAVLDMVQIDLRLNSRRGAEHIGR